MTDYLAQQYAYAKANGWIGAFHRASIDYMIPPALLMAIASRETNMRNIIGDGGHGYGLMQIDSRSNAEWCASGAWRNVTQGIEKGAWIFDGKRAQVEHGVRQSLSIGGTSFIGGGALGDELLRVSTAMYNAGLWPYYCFSIGQPIDRFTTGHNYSTDVWQRKSEFEQLLTKEP